MNSARLGWTTALFSLLIGCLASAPRAAERDIYPAPEQAKSDLSAALSAAATAHKRIILDFGGNWCPDCHALDLHLHDATNQPIIAAHYIVVHVNIGRVNENLDIAKRYQIPLKKGVPALAVLDEHGELLYSQKGGEFESMRSMQSRTVTDFLNRWKPTGT